MRLDDDEDENHDIWGTVNQSDRGERRMRNGDKMLTKGERDGHLKNRQRSCSSSKAHAIRVQRNVREFGYWNVSFSS